LVGYGCNRNPADGGAAATAPRPDEPAQGEKAEWRFTPEGSPGPAAQPGAPEVERDHLGAPIPEVELRARKLIVREPGTLEMSQANLDALVTLMPEIKALGRFWKWVAAVPPSQRIAFRNEILAELRALKPSPGPDVASVYRDAFTTAKGMRDPEVAQIALEQLPLVRVYRFPSEPPPEGWPIATPETIERLAHGDQGVLAEIVVEIGDQQALAKLREMVMTAGPETQRTLIWALGRSREIADFELLMALREKVAKTPAEYTLVRSLNRIPMMMEADVKNPETFPEARVRDIEQLRKNAAECKARLMAMGLVVELSFYD
jgi:hypothetical protein